MSLTMITTTTSHLTSSTASYFSQETASYKLTHNKATQIPNPIRLVSEISNSQGRKNLYRLMHKLRNESLKKILTSLSIRKKIDFLQ